MGVYQMSVGTPIQVRLQKDELDVLDRYRRKQSDPPTRGRALRDLTRAALRSSMSSHDESDDRRASDLKK
jgi:hypothetical protein